MAVAVTSVRATAAVAAQFRTRPWNGTAVGAAALVSAETLEIYLEEHFPSSNIGGGYTPEWRHGSRVNISYSPKLAGVEVTCAELSTIRSGVLSGFKPYKLSELRPWFHALTGPIRAAELLDELIAKVQ